MHMKRLPILASLLILTACTVAEAPTPTASPSPTSTASVTPTATATVTASITPSITPSPTATEIQSTPDFLALPISNDPLFAPGPEADCQLPCWQGLRIGESTDEDIQRVLDETFDFNGTVDFFNDALSLPPSLIIDAPDIYTAGYIWELPEVGTGITLLLVTEETTKKLQGIQLTYSPGGAYSVHTPQQIISELGSPNYIYLDVNVTSGYFIHIKSNLIYKAGMHFTHVIDIPIQEGESVGNYCLNAPSRTIRDSIFEPLNGLTRENAMPVQKAWLFEYFDRVRPKPIDEVLGLTIEEFTEIALRDENPCIEINPDMLLSN